MASNLRFNLTISVKGQQKKGCFKQRIETANRTSKEEDAGQEGCTIGLSTTAKSERVRSRTFVVTSKIFRNSEDFRAFKSELPGQSL